jgi:hypothetical protein
MTNEQINRAIAMLRGWKFVEDDPNYEPYWEDPKGTKIAVNFIEHRVPNCAGCLNAMHEAIETISVGEKSTYIIHLMDICREHPIGCVPDWTRDKQSLARLVQATARQRAEAFLRTLGKWEDEA